MEKIMLIVFLALFGLSLKAQKYYTKSGTTFFKAAVDAFEPVEAVNKTTTAIINTANGEIAALLFLKSFHFKVALMEEHFNENYMDSDRFPKATFKGKVEGFDISELDEKEREYPLSGTINIRGIAKEIITKVKFKKLEDKLISTSELIVSPEDFEIKIPGIVKEKIAEKIKITMNYELIKKS